MHFINVTITPKQEISILKDKFLFCGNLSLLYTLFGSTGVYFISQYTTLWRNFVKTHECLIIGIIIVIMICSLAGVKIYYLKTEFSGDLCD